MEDQAVQQNNASKKVMKYDSSDNDENNNPQVILDHDLDYNFMGWTKIPCDCIHGHPYVRILELADNELTRLPDCLVTAMPLVRRLDVARNRLTSFPANIGSWKLLRELHAPHNQISRFRISMADIMGLEYLNMEGNPFHPNVVSYFTDMPVEWTAKDCRWFAQQVFLFALQMKYAQKKAYEAAAYYEKRGQPLTTSVHRQLVKEARRRRRSLALAPVESIPGATPYEATHSAIIEYLASPRPSIILQLVNSHSKSLASMEPCLEAIDVNQGSNLGFFKTWSIYSGSHSAPAMQSGDGRKKRVLASFRETYKSVHMSNWKVAKSIMVCLIYVVLTCIKVALWGGCTFVGLATIAAYLTDKTMLERVIEFNLMGWTQEDAQRAFMVVYTVLAAHITSISVYLPVYQAVPGGFFTAAVALVAGFAQHFFDIWDWVYLNVF